LALRLRVFAVQPSFTPGFRCGRLRDWGWGEDFLTAKEEKFAKEELFFEFFTFLTWRLRVLAVKIVSYLFIRALLPSVVKIPMNPPAT